MTIPDLIAREIGGIRPYTGPPITDDMHLDTDLDCCQLDRLCIVGAVEEAFGIEIPDAEFEGWQTVACVRRSVETRT